MPDASLLLSCLTGAVCCFQLITDLHDNADILSKAVGEWRAAVYPEGAYFGSGAHTRQRVLDISCFYTARGHKFILSRFARVSDALRAGKVEEAPQIWVGPQGGDGERPTASISREIVTAEYSQRLACAAAPLVPSDVVCVVFSVSRTQ